MHKQDNTKIMNENKTLIWTINELKRECKFYRDKEKIGKLELAKLEEEEAFAEAENYEAMQRMEDADGYDED